MKNNCISESANVTRDLGSLSDRLYKLTEEDIFTKLAQDITSDFDNYQLKYSKITLKAYEIFKVGVHPSDLLAEDAVKELLNIAVKRADVVNNHRGWQALQAWVKELDLVKSTILYQEFDLYPERFEQKKSCFKDSEQYKFSEKKYESLFQKIDSLKNEYKSFIQNYTDICLQTNIQALERQVHVKPVWLKSYDPIQKKLLRRKLKLDYWGLLPRGTSNSKKEEEYFLPDIKQDSPVKRANGGTHLVMVCGDIHFKFHFGGAKNYDESLVSTMPPISFSAAYAVYALDTLLGTNATAECQLILLQQGTFSYPVLATSSVRGEELSETLTHRRKHESSLVTQLDIDQASFCRLFILGLLIGPEDWKSDNLFIDSQHKTITAIDNDLSFQYEVILQKLGYVLRIWNIANCCKQQLLQGLPEKDPFLQRLLKINPYKLVLDWLIHMQRLEAVFKVYENAFSPSHPFVKLNLFLMKLVPKIAQMVLAALIKIQATLQANQASPLQSLFAAVYPVLEMCYQVALRKADDDIEGAFSYITNNTATTIPEYLPNCPMIGNQSLQQYLEQNHVKGKDYYLEARTQTITSAIEQYLEGLDFTCFNGKEKSLILDELKGVEDLKVLALNGFDDLGDYINLVPKANELHITNCQQLTEKSLIYYAGKYPSVKFIIQNCAQVNLAKLLANASSCTACDVVIKNRQGDYKTLTFTRSGQDHLYQALAQELDDFWLKKINDDWPEAFFGCFAIFSSELKLQQKHNSEASINIEIVKYIERLVLHCTNCSTEDFALELRKLYQCCNGMQRVSLYQMLANTFRKAKSDLWVMFYDSIKSICNKDGWCAQIDERQFRWREALNTILRKDKFGCNLELVENSEIEILLQHGHILMQMQDPQQSKITKIKTYQLDPNVYTQLFDFKHQNQPSKFSIESNHTVTFFSIKISNNKSYNFCCKFLPENIPKEMLCFWVDNYLGNDAIPCGMPVKFIRLDNNTHEKITFAAYLMEDIRQPILGLAAKSVSEVFMERHSIKLDPVSYTKNLLRTLIMFPSDGKWDDLFLAEDAQGQHQIKSVDNERIGSDETVATTPDLVSPLLAMEAAQCMWDKEPLAGFSALDLNLWAKAVTDQMLIVDNYLRALFTPDEIKVHFKETAEIAKKIGAKISAVKENESKNYCLLLFLLTDELTEKLWTRLQLAQGIAYLFSQYAFETFSPFALASIVPKNWKYYQSLFQSQSVLFENLFLTKKEIEGFQEFSENYQLTLSRSNNRNSNTHNPTPNPSALTSKSHVSVISSIQHREMRWKDVYKALNHQKNSILAFQNIIRSHQTNTPFQEIIKNIINHDQENYSNVKHTLSARQGKLLFEFLTEYSRSLFRQNQQRKIKLSILNHMSNKITKLDFSLFKTIPFGVLKTIFSFNFSKNLTAINLSNCNYLRHHYLTKQLLSMLKTVETLKLNDIRTMYYSSVFLSDFTLINLDFSVWHDIKHLQLKDCPYLEKIVLTSRSLETLSLSGNKNLKFMQIDCSNLKEIDLTDCNNLRAIKIASNSLKELSLRHAKGLEELKLACPNLIGLDITGCSKLKGREKKEVFQNCSQLQDSGLQGFSLLFSSIRPSAKKTFFVPTLQYLNTPTHTRKNASEVQLLKVVLIGGGCPPVGKSSLMEIFLNKEFRENTDFTIGVEFAAKSVMVGQQECRLQIWDTAGQVRFKTIIKSYYRQACVVICICSIDSLKSLDILDEFVSALPDKNVPKLLVANKCDRIGYEEISEKELSFFAKKISAFGIFKCSAKTGENVEEMFMVAAKLGLQYELEGKYLEDENRLTPKW